MLSGEAKNNLGKCCTFFRMRLVIDRCIAVNVMYFYNTEGIKQSFISLVLLIYYNYKYIFVSYQRYSEGGTYTFFPT